MEEKAGSQLGSRLGKPTQLLTWNPVWKLISRYGKKRQKLTRESWKPARKPTWKPILLSLSIVLLACSGRELKSIPETPAPTLADFETSYWLLDRTNKDIIGETQTRLQGYTTKGNRFYRVRDRFSIEWETASRSIQMKMEHHSIVDEHFRLRSFFGTVKQKGNSEIRSGFYRKPYFYLKHSGKQERIYVPNGIFSKLVEQYILKYRLKKVGDSVSYHFLNLSTLEVEEENLYFYHLKKTKQEKKDQPRIRKILRLINYTQNYTDSYSLNEQNQIVSKSTFRDSIDWKLKTVAK